MLAATAKFKKNSAVQSEAHPVLLLTISNGAAHTRAAEAIATAWRAIKPQIPARIVDVSNFMSPLARFTHVTAYLWLVKRAPVIWDKIDRYQKRQTNTSPEWFYRRECRKLFDLIGEIKPRALVATEVGCGEIAALIKRDLNLDIPLVAVSLDYDADRAWIQKEVDLYCLATSRTSKNFEKHGAPPDKIAAWGVPMQKGFTAPNDFERKIQRLAVCDWLGLDPNKSLIVVAGGGEGIGKIREITAKLLSLKLASDPQIIVLCGRNEALKDKCERLALTENDKKRLRVLGWITQVPQIYQSADVLISKLGNTYDEALACALPIIALPPPPGAERAQYELLEELRIGRAVRTVGEMAQIVAELIKQPEILIQMRKRMRAGLGQTTAATRIADWLAEQILIEQ